MSPALRPDSELSLLRKAVEEAREEARLAKANLSAARLALIAACASLLTFAACSVPEIQARVAHLPNSNSYIAALSVYQTADPIHDCRAAIRVGDTRFNAVYGYVREFPGIDSQHDAALIRRHGSKVIEGTSDALTGPEHKFLDALARHYAARYNLYLRDFLRDHPNA